MVFTLLIAFETMDPIYQRIIQPIQICKKKIFRDEDVIHCHPNLSARIVGRSALAIIVVGRPIGIRIVIASITFIQYHQ
jgi:hypothetical protein